MAMAAATLWPTAAGLLLLSTLILVSAQQPAIDVWEGAPCSMHIDCRREATGLICISYNSAPFECRCQTYLINPPQAVIPYYRKDLDRCVIRSGHICAHDVDYHPFPTMSAVECEPNSYCLRDKNVKNSNFYGRCTRGAGENGAQATHSPFRSWSWLVSSVICGLFVITLY